MLTNPGGAFGGTVLNWQLPVSFKNADAAALARGDVCFCSFSTTTGEVTVTKAATTTDLDFLFGVVDEAIAVGDYGRVIIHGFAYVNVGGGTVAHGDGAIRSGATAGLAAPVTEDATTITGQTMGMFLGVKGSTSPYPFANAAPIWVGKF